MLFTKKIKNVYKIMESCRSINEKLSVKQWRASCLSIHGKLYMN